MSDAHTSDRSNHSSGATIARNAAFVTLGRVLLKVFGFLFTVFVVRQLGDDQYGRYSIVVAWVGLFSIFVELGITQYAMREIARSDQRAGPLFWNLVAMRLALALVGLIIIPIGASIAGYSGDIRLGVTLYVLTFVISAFQAPLEATLTAREAFGWLTVTTVIGQASWIILGAVAMWFRPDFVWLIGMGLIAMLPQLAVDVWIVARLKLVDWRIHLQLSEWPRLIRAGLPFAVISLSLTIAFGIDTIMLSWYVPDAEVGWYNVAYGLVRSMVALLNGFSIAMLPTAARVYATDKGAVARWHAQIIRFIALAATPVAVGGMLVAQPLVRFLYTPELSPAALPLAIIVWDVPLLMYAAACGNLTTAIGEEKAAARINLLNALANVVLNAIVIPRYGMVGAAAVTVATDVIASVQFTQLLRKRLSLPNMLGTLIRVGLASLGLAIAVALAGSQHVLILMGLGVLVYGALAFAVGAIGPEERELGRRMLAAGRRRLDRGLESRQSS